MILATSAEKLWRSNATKYLDDRSVGTSEGIFWNTKCISLMTIILATILHTIYLDLIIHLMDWVTSYLEHHSRMDKFNLLWAMLLPYPSFA